MGEHLIEDAVWQRMLAALAEVPHMRLHDPDGLRRFVGAARSREGALAMAHAAIETGSTSPQHN